jgi:photosystem II stability/assembly factor-like uncharacterized protein
MSFNLKYALEPNQQYASIAINDGGTYIIGGNNSIVKSINNGQIWNKIPIINDLVINSIVYGDNKWVAVGNNYDNIGIIISSNNSGKTWSESIIIDETTVLKYVAYQNRTWVAVGNNVDNHGVILTSNNGSDWSKPNIVNSTKNLNTVSYGDDTWMISGNNNNDNIVVLKSIDNGNNWSDPIIVSNKGTIKSIAYGDNTWICGGYLNIGVIFEYKIFKSVNKGINWTEITQLGLGSIYSVAYGNNTWLCAGSEGQFGTGGIIFKSRNNFDSYSLITSPNINFYYCVAYTNNKWIGVGKLKLGSSNNSIFQSIDNGVNWEIIYNYENNNMLVNATYYNNVWITIGYNDTRQKPIILRSINNGISWSNITINTRSELNSILYNNGIWIVAGNKPNTLLNSIDDGQTWSTITNNLPDYPSLETVISVDNTLFAILNNGFPVPFYYSEILNSIDNGKTWQSITKIRDINLRSLIYNGNNTIIGTGLNLLNQKGIIIKSIDKGITWSTPIFINNSSYIYSAEYKDNIWIAVGADLSKHGLIVRSLDNGETWLPAIIDSTVNQFRSITYGNGLWITIGQTNNSAFNKIIYSTDNGESWKVKKFYTPGYNNINKIIYANNKFLIIGNEIAYSYYKQRIVGYFRYQTGNTN